MFSKILKIFTPIQWCEVILIVVIAIVGFNLGNSIIDKVQNVFGIETKASLKEKTIEQSNIINKIESVNKDLVVTIDTNNKSNEITKNIIVDNFKSELKLDTNIRIIKNKKVEGINKIKDDFEKLPVTVENTKEMERQVSTKQINSLWDAYCLDPANSTQCEINKNA